MGIDNLLQNLLQSLLIHMKVNFRFQKILRDAPVYKTQILGQNLIEDKTSQRRFHIPRDLFPVHIFLGYTHGNPGMERTSFVFICQNGLVYIAEKLPLAQCPGPLLGQIIDAQHHILRRHCHRAAVGRL